MFFGRTDATQVTVGAELCTQAVQTQSWHSLSYVVLVVQFPSLPHLQAGWGDPWLPPPAALSAFLLLHKPEL